MKRILFVVTLACASGAGADQVRTWCGPGGEQDWNASTNWVDGLVATGDDSAYFPQNNAYHFNNTGRRRAYFKVTPPEGFTGVILTTNEFAVADYSAANYNMNFRPVVELAVSEGASWTVEGNGCVVATDGMAGRLSAGFTGTVDVRLGQSFTVPSAFNAAADIIGAGTLVLTAPAQAAQAAAFAGTVRLPADIETPVADLTVLRNARLELADGGTFVIDGGTAAFNTVSEIESFADVPEKWSFNGTSFEEGNIPSGPFNADPPYVRDGELWLTDEPAQVHTVWYRNRRFRLTDSWGMKFTYWPDLPSGTRITDEKRADGNGRSQSICGYFGILFSRHSPDNCCEASLEAVTGIASDARGFMLSLYRDDGGARACWVSEGGASSFRSMGESRMNGIKLNRKIDFTVSMIAGTMTVTMEQDGKSVSFARDYSIIASRAPEGCYVGFAGSSSWWGDSNAVPWVRNRVSGFSAWYCDPTEAAGWEEIPSAASFDIRDSGKWNYRKVKREHDENVDLSESLFTEDGVKLLDSVSNNTAYIISKAKVGKWDSPIAYRVTMKTANPYFKADADAYVTLLFGDNNDSTRNTGTSWMGSYYNSAFGSWTRGLGAIWNINRGTLLIERAKWGGDGVPSSVTECMRSTGMGNTFVAATISPEKNLRADFIYDGAGTLKSICETSLQDHTLSRTTTERGNGMIGVLTWSDMADVAGFHVFTNKEQYVGVKAMGRVTSYADLTMTSLSIRRMTSARCGTAGSVTVPADAYVTLRAGEAMGAQTADVVTLSGVGLDAGSSLTVNPETTATVAGLAKITSAGASVTAGEGATVRLGEHLVLTGDPADPGLVLSGNVTAPASLTVVIPSSWRRYSREKIYLIDATGVTSGFEIDPSSVVLRGEDGTVLTGEGRLEFSGGCLSVDFRHGMVIVVR